MLYDSERSRLMEEDIEKGLELKALRHRVAEAEMRAGGMGTPGGDSAEELRSKLRDAQEELEEKRDTMADYQNQLAALEANIEAENTLTEKEMWRLRHEVERLQEIIDEMNDGGEKRAELDSMRMQMVADRRRFGAMLMWVRAKNFAEQRPRSAVQTWRRKTMDGIVASLGNTSRSHTGRSRSSSPSESRRMAANHGRQLDGSSQLTPNRWEWEDENHLWHGVCEDVSMQLEDAEKSRLGRIQLMAGLGTDQEVMCTFLLNQRKVVSNLGDTYLLRRRQPKITLQAI